MRSPSDPPLPPRARLRWTVVEPMIRDLRPRSILELGCGLGAFGARLARIGRYTAAEPDRTSWAAADARITPLGGVVIHGDHTAVPPGDGYDLVCAFEVIEHIADDAAALREWLTLVRPGGHLLLSVPADPHRFGPHDELVGHYRRYTGDGMRRLLTDAGATDVVIRHYAWPLGYLLEVARNRASRARLAGAAATADARTGSSGRFLQPRSVVVGALVRAGVAPFGLMQRLRPGHGPGLVALARVGGKRAGGGRAPA